MDTRDRERPGERDERSFERLLLESASVDQVSDAAVQRAWSEFARASIGMAPRVVAARGRGEWLQSAAVKGWIVGVLCGGAITAAWLGEAPASSHIAAHAASVTLSAAPPRGVAQRDAVARGLGDTAPSPRGDAVTPAPVVQARAASPRAAHVKHAAPTVPGERAVPASEQSAAEQTATARGAALAAEVAALDAVRSAIAGRTYLRALRMIDDYHRAFPAGQLAPDAEALAIEAFAAEGDRAAAEQRATQFLERYPNTPHAARIAALLERSSR
jgi:hypothetical protein